MKFTCKKALCPECFIADHNGHEVKKVKDLYEEKIKIVESPLEPLKDKINYLKAISTF